MATSTTTNTTTAVTTKDMKSKQLYLSMPRIPPKVYLETVNPHITCNLCKGYLIDATTIVECLHSFCRSCIMMHLSRDVGRDSYCPSCEIMINKVKPNIKPDATLQAIVYKLVPGLYEKELLRRRAFYRKRTKEALEATPEQRGDDTEHLIFGPNESISLMLEYSDNENAHQMSDDENSNSSHEINSSDHCDDDLEVQLRKPKYLQCPAIFTISNLKKFLLHKFSINPSKFCVEIMYKVKSLALPDHYTLMDVAYIFTWKRDAPMKFLYCVRAASSPVAMSAVMYDLPPNRFQASSQLTCASDSTDLEQDQSSDADSEARSERAKATEINGSDCQTAQEEPINSTSDEPTIVPTTASSTSQLTLKATSSATVTSTSRASTSSKSKSEPGSHSSINGGETQRKEISSKISNEIVSSPTTSSRLESRTTSIKTERFSSSPEKQQPDRKTNGTSPKPNTSKSRSAPDIKPSVSPSRTNQDLKDSKEKVKTKSIMVDSSGSKSNDSPSNRSEPKTVTFSDKPSPTRTISLANDSKSTPSIDRSKGRLLFNKDEKAKSLSPPLSAENEYDFDQHLLKEKLSEKKKFLSSINLTPCKPSTDSPLVQLPIMPKTEQKSEATTTTNTSSTSTTTASTTTPTTTNTSTSITSTPTATTTITTTNPTPTNVSKDKDSSNKLSAINSTIPPIRPSVSSSSSNSNMDKQPTGMKKPEIKASKRKSREPVKNVAKVKCSSPNERAIDMKWDSIQSNISSASSSPLMSPAALLNLSNSLNSSNTDNDQLRKIQETKATMARLLGAMPTQNKLKSITSSTSSSVTKVNHASPASSSLSSSSASASVSTPTTSNATTSSKSVFKTPTSSTLKDSSSTQSTGLKQQSQPSTSESETSIIINNVQRPNQADTPRPPMSFKPNHGQQQPFYFSPNLNRIFPNGTEIQEICNDDTGTVYGPAMNLAKSFETPMPGLSTPVPPDLFSLPQLFNQFGKQPQFNFPLGTLPQLNQLVAFQQLHNLQLPLLDALKNNKSKKSATDGKKSNLNNFDGKVNSLPKNMHAIDSTKSQNAQSFTLPIPCKIPPSLSITLTNDESEMASRSIFNTRNSNVVNSIEIVKLPDETNETNARIQSSSPSSSSSSTTTAAGEKAWQTSKNANNQIKLLTNQQNNQIDSTSFQEKFMQSLLADKTSDPLKNLKKLKPSQHLQPIRPNTNLNDELRKREAQKRRQQLINDEKAAKLRRLQPNISPKPQKPTTLNSNFRRPVPELLVPKSDDKKVTVPNSSSGNASSSTSQTSTSRLNTSSTNSKQSTDDHRQSPKVSSNVTSSDKTTANVTVAVAPAQVQSNTKDIPTSKYLPLQTSSMPIWANHCTADQMASHKALVENLTQSKKNSGTFVD